MNNVNFVQITGKILKVIRPTQEGVREFILNFTDCIDCTNSVMVTTYDEITGSCLIKEGAEILVSGRISMNLEDATELKYDNAWIRTFGEIYAYEIIPINEENSFKSKVNKFINNLKIQFFSKKEII